MGLYPGGLISGIMYSFENGWAYIWGGGGGLKPGGLKVGFYSMSFIEVKTRGFTVIITLID